jgi:histone H3/H4
MNDTIIADVILTILKETGVSDYESSVVVSLCDFVYNYVISVFEEAQNFAANSNHLNRQDIEFAIKFVREKSFLFPRKETVEYANEINRQPLPSFSGKYGVNLPSERHCLNRCNYSLKNNLNKESTAHNETTTTM